ncbi:rhomboid family intramembrane serine protease GlpG [Gallaecimonas sp. GXIMD1310]|uniref:rhomboid family intramembrane serine protease GlpG n=1 Tax=Gallaecimonas sp. GXIMD1310 TaxID=3131926 RepID=UPI003250E88F
MSEIRKLGPFPDPRLAQGFVDYLQGQGLRARMQPAEGGVVIEVAPPQPDWLASAWQQFLDDPGHPRYQAASWQSPATDRPVFQYQSQMRSLRHSAGPVTWLVLAACVAIYLSALLGMRGLYDALAFPRSLAAVDIGNAYRLITPVLLHFSVLHILFNLLWWWQLGGILEKRLGSVHLLALMLVTGFAGNLAQFLDTGPAFGGLSGVVYGLFGYFWLSGLVYPQRGIGLPNVLVIFMLAWLVLGFVGLGLPIANQAHLWGLIAGAALALVPFAGHKKAQ